MNVAVISAGSRGDLEMFVPLVRRLERAGHGVRLLINAELAGGARRHGLEFDTLRRSVSDTARAFERRGGNLRDPRELWRRPLALRGLFRDLEEWFLSASHDIARACAAADVVLAAPIGFAALDVAERGGPPVVQVAAYPLSRTRAFGSFLAPPDWRLRGRVAWLSHVLVERVAWRLLGRVINRFRREALGLPALGRRAWLARLDARRVPLLYAWSEVLLPRPDDWPTRAQVTGYFFPEAVDGPLPTPLARFVADGPPPLYVSFSTITAPDRRRFAAALVEALRRSGRRALALRPWPDGVPAPPERVHLVDPLPYALLLPHTCGVLHHGGQGSVAAALRAGVPSVALPGVVDHHFWGERLRASGLGAAPLPAREIDTARLLRVMDELMQPALVQRVRAASVRVRAEDGVGRALLCLEEQAAAGRRTP